MLGTCLAARFSVDSYLWVPCRCSRGIPTWCSAPSLGFSPGTRFCSPFDVIQNALAVSEPSVSTGSLLSYLYIALTRALGRGCSVVIPMRVRSGCVRIWGHLVSRPLTPLSRALRLEGALRVVPQSYLASSRGQDHLCCHPRVGVSAEIGARRTLRHSAFILADINLCWPLVPGSGLCSTAISIRRFHVSQQAPVCAWCRVSWAACARRVGCCHRFRAVDFGLWPPLPALSL